MKSDEASGTKNYAYFADPVDRVVSGQCPGKRQLIQSFAGKNFDTAPLDNLIERMEREEFDLIAVGRALLQDPLWVTKVRDGHMDELQKFDSRALATLY